MRHARLTAQASIPRRDEVNYPSGMSGDPTDPTDPKDPKPDPRREPDTAPPRSLTSKELSREAADAFRGAGRTAESLQKRLSAGDFKIDLGADAHARTLLQKSVNKIDPAVRAPKMRSPQSSPTWTFGTIPGKGLAEERLKGILPHAVHHWIQRGYGEAGIQAVVKHLPQDLGARFESDAFNAMEWCTLEEVHELLETATAKVLGGHAVVFREIAEENYPFELAGLFRSTSRSPDLVIKRSPVAWGRIFDFGRVRVVDADGALVLCFDDFSRVGAPLRHIIVGTMTGLLATAETVVTVDVAAGLEPFSPELHLAFNWAR